MCFYVNENCCILINPMSLPGGGEQRLSLLLSALLAILSHDAQLVFEHVCTYSEHSHHILLLFSLHW